MGLNKDLLKHWNKILCRENLGLIESNQQIFPEKIVMDYKMIQLRSKAAAWLEAFDASKLEKIRCGELKGSPNYMHKRVIEMFSQGQSTREISRSLKQESVRIGFQGVARIISRYLGGNR